ncbi:MAG: FAD-binding oxidoreductase, partial [Pseudomonadota bacterium]
MNANCNAVENALKALERALSASQIALPNTPPYTDSITIDNGRVHYSPAAVVYPETVTDVQQVIAICRAHDVHMTVLNGGHNAVGWCLNNGGIVLHMTRMRELELDTENRMLSVQCGLVWGDVYDSLRESDLLPIGGGSKAVGVSGFTLGGGFSFVSRSHGLAIDNLVSIDVVTVDGEVLTLGAHESDPDRADLFWALRGGGGGNFAVATRFTSALHRSESQALSGILSWDIASARTVLRHYRDWMDTLPDTIDPAVIVSPTQLILIVFYNGPYRDGLELMQPMLDLAPLTNALKRSSFYDFMDTYGSSTNSLGKSSYIKFGNLKHTLSDAFIDTLVEHMASAPSAETQVAIEYAGGAIDRVAPAATAFPWRGIRARCEIKATWQGSAHDEANIAWADRLHAALADALSGGDVNQQDPALINWA